MNPLFKIFGITTAFLNFNNNVKKIGWYKANARLMVELSIRVKSGLPNFKKKGGVLVYANHPTGLDPYVLMSQMGREDSYFLSDVYQTLKGEEVGAHILSVYYWNLLDFIWKPFLAWPGFFIMRIIGGTVEKEEAKIRNEKTIKEAVLYLKQGKTVVVFPSGGERGFRPWKAGVGRIIIEANKERVDYSLYQIKIEGLSEARLLLHLISGRWFLKLLPVELLGKPVELGRGIEKLGAYQVAAYLRKIFYE